MFDVFLSYSSSNLLQAKKLADDLTKYGIQVFFAEWSLGPGDSLVEKLSTAIETSAYLFVLLSPSAINSKWVKQELRQAISDELDTGRLKVVPVMIETCELPGYLKDKLYLDLRDEQKYTYNLQKLVDLVFDGPKIQSVPRPELGEELIKKYREFAESKDTHIDQFRRVTRRLLIALTKMEYAPGGVDSQAYIGWCTRRALFAFQLGELNQSEELFFCAAEEAEIAGDLNDLITVQLHLACLAAARVAPLEEVIRRFSEALHSLRSFIGYEAQIDIGKILDFIVRFFFMDDVMDDVILYPHLVLDCSGDQHRLNMRIDIACQGLFHHLIESGAPNEFEIHFADGLVSYGLIRPAVRFYRSAERKGIAHASERLEKIEGEMETLRWLAAVTEGRWSEDDTLPKAGFRLNDPQTMRRMGICAGARFDIAKSFESSFMTTQKIDEGLNERIDNKIKPACFVLFDRGCEQTQALFNALTKANIGGYIVHDDKQLDSVLMKEQYQILCICDQRKPNYPIRDITDFRACHEKCQQNQDLVLLLLCDDDDDNLAIRTKKLPLGRVLVCQDTPNTDIIEVVKGMIS